MHLFIVLLCILSIIANATPERPDFPDFPPVINPNFAVDTLEISGPASAGTSNPIVQQTITQDIDERRSNMIAIGSLVNGALQQVKRCDLSPSEGWYVQANGIKPNAPDSWSCTNMTIPVIDEEPQNCQYSSFWTFPKITTYAGVEDINGSKCDKWTYRMDNSGSVYAFWAIQDKAVPCAAGRIENPSSPDSLYTIFFSNFKSGSQPESVYYPEAGVTCPTGTSPSKITVNVAENEAVKFPSTLVEMMDQANARVDSKK